jgi:hypothetical protein
MWIVAMLCHVDTAHQISLPHRFVFICRSAEDLPRDNGQPRAVYRNMLIKSRGRLSSLISLDIESSYWCSSRMTSSRVWVQLSSLKPHLSLIYGKHSAVHYKLIWELHYLLPFGLSGRFEVVRVGVLPTVTKISVDYIVIGNQLYFLTC